MVQTIKSRKTWSKISVPGPVPIWTALGANLIVRNEKPVTTLLYYGTTIIQHFAVYSGFLFQ